MILGTLLKITAQKKLMIKISPDTYHRINQRIEAMAKKNNFTEYSKPTWRSEQAYSLSEQAYSLSEQTDTHFLMVKLDQYDVQNMQKFNRLIKSDVALDGFPKSYAFIPDGQDQQKCGINFVLTTIRAVKKQQTGIFAQLKAIADEESAKEEARILDQKKVRMTALELAIDADVEKRAGMLAQPVAQQVGLLAQRFSLSKQACLLLPTPPALKRFESQMTALELAIDADVEQQMIERFNLPVTSAQ